MMEAGMVRIVPTVMNRGLEKVMPTKLAALRITSSTALMPIAYLRVCDKSNSK